METATPIIVCIDPDLLLVVDDEVKGTDDLIYDTRVCWCEIYFRFVLYTISAG